MDASNSCNTSAISSLESSPTTSVKAKIRRLKIQEELLLQNITKNFSYIGDAENGFIKSNLEFKRYLHNIKAPYNEIKLMFEDVKCTAKSQDILKTLDIDDVKKDVLALEDKLKKYKVFLEKELINLKTSENVFLQELNEDISQNIKTKKLSKVAPKNYSDIVPSPVKIIINSPLKCPDVQKFQDFLKNSFKYGGWKEYNHNIFIKLWQKYSKSQEDIYLNPENITCEDKDTFVSEVLGQTGSSEADIVSHMKWYSKYLNLKKRQQLALDEWRMKRKPTKKQNRCQIQNKDLIKTTKGVGFHLNKSGKTGNQGQSLYRQNSLLDDPKTHSKTTEERSINDCVYANAYLKEINHINRFTNVIQDRTVFHFTKPTKQWLNKCKTSPEPQQIVEHNIEEIGKLGTPVWRLGLEKQ